MSGIEVEQYVRLECLKLVERRHLSVNRAADMSALIEQAAELEKWIWGDKTPQVAKPAAKKRQVT